MNTIKIFGTKQVVIVRHVNKKVKMFSDQRLINDLWLQAAIAKRFEISTYKLICREGFRQNKNSVCFIDWQSQTWEKFCSATLVSNFVHNINLMQHLNIIGNIRNYQNHFFKLCIQIPKCCRIQAKISFFLEDWKKWKWHEKFYFFFLNNLLCFLWVFSSASSTSRIFFARTQSQKLCNHSHWNY